MNRAEVLNAIDEAFSGEPRPTMFIPGTCLCPECTEHNETMRRFKPKELPLDALDNQGWDPICFASDAAFRYLMPGLARLVLAHAGDYIHQFLLHVQQQDRMASLTPSQTRAVVGVIDFLVREESAAVRKHLVADELFSLRSRLEQAAVRRPSSLPGVPPL